MQEIVTFVSTAIAGGVIGNTSYDGLKVVFGSSFDKLLSYLSNGEDSKFEGALEVLLEDDILREKIKMLMDGKIIDNSFKNLNASKIDVELGKGAKITDSFKDNKNSPIKIR